MFDFIIPRSFTENVPSEKLNDMIIDFIKSNGETIRENIILYFSNEDHYCKRNKVQAHITHLIKNNILRLSYLENDQQRQVWIGLNE